MLYTQYHLNDAVMKKCSFWNWFFIFTSN